MGDTPSGKEGSNRPSTSSGGAGGSSRDRSNYQPFRSKDGRNRRDEERNTDLLVRMRYCNTLPDIPFDPKFINCPFIDLNRFVEYKTTSLEKNYKHELLTEPDLGVKIDLINPATYAIDYTLPDVKMHPTDEKLLEDEVANLNDHRRSKQHSKIVPWMRKTEYISSEFNRFGTQTERQETKVGYNIKKLFKEDNLYRDRQAQIDAINRTFEEVAKPVRKHYAKRDVVPISESPVFPDHDLWKFPFAQVIFDSDPSPQNQPQVLQTEKMCQALIRGMMDESGEQFVAYFLPTDETLDKRRRAGDPEYQAKKAADKAAQEEADKDKEKEVDEDGNEIEKPVDPDKQQDYKLAREYNWTVKNKASKGYEENYFFVFRGESVYYNELETRVRLSRRRAKEGAPKIVNSRLIVTEREYDEGEIAAQDERMTQLQPPGDDEEEEEEQAEGEAAADEGGVGNGENEEEGGKKGDDDDEDEGGVNNTNNDEDEQEGGDEGNDKKGGDDDNNSDDGETRKPSAPAPKPSAAADSDKDSSDDSDDSDDDDKERSTTTKRPPVDLTADDEPETKRARGSDDESKSSSSSDSD